MFPVHRNTYVKYIPTYYTDVLTRTFHSECINNIGYKMDTL